MDASLPRSIPYFRRSGFSLRVTLLGVALTVVSISSLTDISKSITMYLHDESSVYRVLAIDLCSRGFHVWQHYVDTMEILRSLFMLSTNVRKDSISIQNVNSQARLAVLSIASNNIQLFMSTLCLDILTPPTLEHRRSVMQIVAFLIRKVWLIFTFALCLLYNDSWLSAASHSPAHPPKTLGSCYQILGSEFDNKPRCSIRYRD